MWNHVSFVWDWRQHTTLSKERNAADTLYPTRLLGVGVHQEAFPSDHPSAFSNPQWFPASCQATFRIQPLKRTPRLLHLTWVTYILNTVVISLPEAFIVTATAQLDDSGIQSARLYGNVVSYQYYYIDILASRRLLPARRGQGFVGVTQSLHPWAPHQTLQDAVGNLLHLQTASLFIVVSLLDCTIESDVSRAFGQAWHPQIKKCSVPSWKESLNVQMQGGHSTATTCFRHRRYRTDVCLQRNFLCISSCL